MLEELKQVMELLLKMPELAFHGLVAFGIYKLVIYLSTAGAIYKLGSLAIVKIHDAVTRPKEVTMNWDIGRFFITNDGAHSKFEKLLEIMKTDRYKTVKESPKSGPLLQVLKPHNYIFADDVQYLIDAYNEKLARDRDAKAAQ